ncbi:DNA-binding BIN4-like isoform B [Micractinium conductrix]|uniref:DNA-binding BIN4-like isoform B n=1 Tax=Micractinium conductrix TaxID=554055 RepID=A0A2P6V6Z4_9CHLO|nr:DNA-binding BIN4-like isoform B [Micractinium conductrix]|eukprot:PSC69861.1 DNA-binding BIN4-like isoform B [Micractinium conductrix]
MGDTSSEDEMPLAQRPLAGGILLGGGRAAPVAGGTSDDDSDIPSWLQAPAGTKGKGNQIVDLADSSDDDAVMSPAKPAAPAPQPAPVGNRSAQPPASQPQSQPHAASPQTQPQAPAQPRSAAKPRATSRGRPPVAAAAAAAAAGPSGAGDDSQAPSQAPPASQATGGTAQKRAPAVLHAPTSRMDVVLPEKLPQIKMLVELERGGSDDVHGVTDLSGDSGAIGRLMIGGSKEEPQLQLDVKGVLYNATVVPCPATIALINMGQSEAKVECLFTEFVQLREDTRFSFNDADQLGGLVEGDDDGNYVDGGDGGAGEGAAAGGAKKGRGKAAAGGSKAAPCKRAAPKAKGGVKKAGGKPKAKPKPKPKAAGGGGKKGGKK